MGQEKADGQAPSEDQDELLPDDGTISEDASKPWTIRHVPPAQRLQAVAAAKRGRMQVGKLVGLLIAAHCREPGRELVPVEAPGPLATIGPAVRQPSEDSPPSLADAVVALDAMARFVAAGEKLPPHHIAKVSLALTRALERGKPARPVGQPSASGADTAADNLVGPEKQITVWTRT